MERKQRKKNADSTSVGFPTSTPYAGPSSTNFSNDISGISSELIQEITEKKPKKKKIIDMICQAISAVGEGKKGASLQAIKKWIHVNNADFKNNRIKLALAKGLEDGVLVRPAKFKNSIGANGRFALAKKIPTKRTKTKTVEKIARKGPNEYASDSEVTLNKGRKESKKLNLSDTEIDDMRKLKKVLPTKPKSKPKKLNVSPTLQTTDKNNKKVAEQKRKMRKMYLGSSKVLIKNTAIKEPGVNDKPTKKAKSKALPEPANSTKNIPSEVAAHGTKLKESARKNAKEKSTVHKIEPINSKRPGRPKKTQE